MAIFRTKKDIEFVKRINKELIEHVIGEKITYYAISKKFSRANLYGESKEKIVDPPVEVYCLPEWQDQNVTTTEFGQDISYEMRVFILNEHLMQIEVDPKEGDFFDYDGVKFEITQITEPNLIFSKAGERTGKRLEAVSVREGTFKISVSASIDQAERTAPDDKAGNKTLYNSITFPYSGSE